MKWTLSPSAMNYFPLSDTTVKSFVETRMFKKVKRKITNLAYTTRQSEMRKYKPNFSLEIMLVFFKTKSKGKLYQP